jgi:hypothetical protein
MPHGSGSVSILGALSSELNVTQRHQDDYDRRYDVDGGHGRYPAKVVHTDRDAEGKPTPLEMTSLCDARGPA